MEPEAHPVRNRLHRKQSVRPDARPPRQGTKRRAPIFLSSNRRREGRARLSPDANRRAPNPRTRRRPKEIREVRVEADKALNDPDVRNETVARAVFQARGFSLP